MTCPGNKSHQHKNTQQTAKVPNSKSKEVFYSFVMIYSLGKILCISLASVFFFFFKSLEGDTRTLVFQLCSVGLQDFLMRGVDLMGRRRRSVEEGLDSRL